MIDDEIDRLTDLDDEIEQYDQRISELRDQRQDLKTEYEATLTTALAKLQDEYEEPLTLLEVNERGRMSFEYEEVLTDDGIETRGGGYHDWDGAVSVEYYLERSYRGTGEHLELLGERLANLDETPPTITYPIPS